MRYIITNNTGRHKGEYVITHPESIILMGLNFIICYTPRDKHNRLMSDNWDHSGGNTGTDYKRNR